METVSSMVRDKKMSVQQMEKMLELVEARPNLGNARAGGPAARSQNRWLWDVAAAALNREDGAVKTGEKWQKAWADWRSKTRSKVRQLAAAAGEGEGSGAPPQAQLSDLELRLLSVLDTFGWTKTNVDELDGGRMIPLALESEREPKMSASQMETMVELMRARPELAAGRAGGSEGWTELAAALNADTNGPCKTADKWQKAWIDWKYKTRTKVTKLEEKAIETGNKQPLKKHLNSLEYKLASLMGWRHIATDDHSEHEDKFHVQSPVEAGSSSGEGAAGSGGDADTAPSPPPLPPARAFRSSKPKGGTVFVRKRQRRRAEDAAEAAAARERTPLAGEFLALERQKLAALRGVGAELAGLRADLRAYFRYCVDDAPPHPTETD